MEFSWNIPPGKKPGLLLDGFTDEDAEDDEDEDDEDDDWELELLGVDGAGFGCEDDAGGATDVGAAGPSEPSTLKTTMFAVFPLGTVTTQKSAFPTPVALTGLSTPPTPLLEGLMEHGKPLQPPAGHSILIPNVGGVFLSEHPMNMGFQAIFT